jgi:outer membrane protein OmpA-like peptidoglycan-associated protein
MRALLALSIASVAAAQSVDIQFQVIVPQGGSPKMVLTAQDDLAWIDVELKSSGFNLKKKFPATGNGQTRELKWKHAPGALQVFGTIRSQVKGGEPEEQMVEFESVIATPLVLKIVREKLDLERGKLVFTLNHPAGKAEVTVRDEDAQIMAEESAFYDGEAPGTELTVSWDAGEKKAARIDVKAYDKWEFFDGVALTPWRVDIPHEEVNFRVDSADIDATEQPKLEASLKLIAEAVRKYKQLGDIKVYVAGHTDTQGSHEHNDKLSTARARSIAGFFFKKGLPVTIYWAGFGERHLLVRTGDNVDEVRNRRVDYVVSVEQPYPANWRKAP